MSAREVSILLLMCTIWGFHLVVIKVAVAELPPLFYAAIRMSLVSILLCPFLRWRPGKMHRVLTAGMCFGGLNYAFMFTGLANAPAAAAALAIELYVPFATILSVMFLGERVGLTRAVSIFVTFAGVVIIALSNDGHEADGGSGIDVGIGLITLAALTEAIGAVIVKKIDDFKPLELLSWFAVVGTLVLWAATLSVEEGQLHALQEADLWLMTGAVLYSAIGGSIIGHTSYYWLLQRMPLSLLAPSGLLTTLLAVIFAVIFLQERLTIPIIIGGVMILTGVGTVIFRTNVRPPNKNIALTEHQS